MKENINKKKVNSNINKYFRISVQVASFLMLPSMFISIFQSMKNIFMGIFHQSGTLSSLMPDIILLALLTVVTAFAGRFFCGWMCAFGSIGDLIYGISKKISGGDNIVPKTLDMILKSVKYIMLFSIVVFVWGLQIISIPSGVNPWDLFGMLLSFGNWPSISELSQGWLPAVFLLLGIIAGSFIVERFFCRYICPLGAYFSIISKIRPLNIIKQRDECGACSLCTKKCSMGINLSKTDKVHSGECINCMACINNCPRSNAHLEIAELNVNSAAAVTASCAVIVGAVYLGNFTNEQINVNNELPNSTVSEEIKGNISGEKALTDGTYQGTGEGFRGETTVEVTVSDGIITDIQILSTNDDDEYIAKASNQIFSNIISSQSEDVDTVSGATYSSKGLIEAVKAALSKASAESEITEATDNNTQATENTEGNNAKVSDDSSATVTLADVEDGTYEGTGTGFRGDTKVSVTVKEGRISDIKILSYQDDQEFFDRASGTVIEEIVSNQDVNVDAVSGATYSSNGIMGAVADALNLEYTQPEVPRGHGGKGKH